MVKRITLFMILIFGLVFAQKGLKNYPESNSYGFWNRVFKSSGFNDRTYNVHNDGALATYFTNYGLIGYYNPTVEYPVNSDHHYAWQIGIMIGGKIDKTNDGVDNPQIYVSDTYEDYGEKNFNPIGGYHNDGLTPRVAVSNNPGTWPENWPNGLMLGDIGWPGLETGNYNPLSSQESFWIMRDFDEVPFDNSETNTPGTGALEVVSRGLQNNSTMTNKFIFFLYDIINRSDKPLTEARAGIMVDPDHPAHLETDYGDDNGEFFPELNLAISYDYDNNYSEWIGEDIAYMGIMFLRSPKNENGEELGMTSWKAFPYSDMPKGGRINGVDYPSRDAAQYAFMKPGVYSPTPQLKTDLCYVMASGDFTILPGDTQQIAIAILMGDSKEEILTTAKSARTIYENDFKTPSSPIPPLVNVYADSGKVTLYWDGAETEESLDKLTGIKDFEGYRVYRSTDLGRTWGATTNDRTKYPLGYIPLADFNKSNSINELTFVETNHSFIRSEAEIELVEEISGSRNLVENEYLITFITDSTFQVTDGGNGWLVERNFSYIGNGYAILDSSDWNAGKSTILSTGTTSNTFTSIYDPANYIYFGGVVIKILNPAGSCIDFPDGCPKAGDIFQIKIIVNDKGEDNGLRHSWTDHSVLNGVEYWYAVTAYDRPDPILNIPVNESSPGTQANSISSPHTVSVIPNGKSAGFIPGALDTSGVKHTSGIGTGPVSINILNEELVQSGEHALQFYNDNNGNLRFYILDVTNDINDTLVFDQTVPNSSVSILNPDFIPVINGYRLEISNHDLEFDDFKLLEGDSSHYDPEHMSLSFPGGNNPKIPNRDIRVVFESNPTTALSQSSTGARLDVPFKVWDVTEFPFELQTMILDRAPRDEFNLQDIIWVLDLPMYENFPEGNFSRVRNDHGLFSIEFNKTQNDGSHAEFDTLFSQNGFTGDVWLMTTLRPFDENDRFEYSFSPSGYVLDKKILDEVKVVPNPFVVASPWDTQEGVHRVQFTHLPEVCKIRIYTVTGDLVKTLDHEGGSVEWWNLRSESDMDVAFGVYLFHVSADSDDGIVETTGKLMVIR